MTESMTRKNLGHSSVSVPFVNPDGFQGRMKMLIEALGSAAEVARRCGFSEAVVRSWRDGKSDPSRERCIALSRGTGASLLWLVMGAEPMWAKDLAPHARDTHLIAFGDPSDPAVQAAEQRRTQAIKDFSAGVKAAEAASESHSQELRREALTMALQLAAEALGGRSLPPEKHAELVSLIYEGLVDGLPEAQILRFARLAAP